MDELLGRLLWRQLVAVGWFEGGEGEFATVTARVRPARHVARWLDASLVMLDELDVVRYSNGTCSGRVEDADALWQEWDRTKEKWFADASVRPRLVIAEAMLRALPEVLRGEKLPTDIIFPGGSVEQVRAVYQGNPLADFFNTWTTDVVVAYVQERLEAEPGARLRLLEVGAGTGSTSVEVFRKLKPYRHAIAEYCYTDLSRAFLHHAEATYGPDAPYLSYRLLDIERAPEEQGFDLGSYDLVLAANVLHATRRIKVTVDNVKTLMRPDALLVLNEMAGINLLTHAAFGLLEGWWLHEDPELRIAGSPALESEVWQSVLQGAGFRQVFFPVRESHHLGGQVVVAESDGVFPGGPSASAPATVHAEPVRGAEPEPHSPVGDQAPAGATADDVYDRLRAELAQALKMPTADIDGVTAFRDYGLDSILGIQFVQRVNTVLGTELATTVLFEHGTLDQLAQHVASLGAVLRPAKGAAPATRAEPEPVTALAQVSVAPAQVAPAQVAPGQVAAETADDDALEPIAIVGLSGRFAGSRTPEELWEHLAAGTDLVGEVTRWPLEQYLGAEAAAGLRGSFLDGHDEFDPLFFGVSGLEAEFMDPQQRVFLEESWTALENAGYAGAGIRGSRCGVYVGFSGGDYHTLYPNGMNSPQAMLGRAGSILSARIAYMLDLRGPAVTVDTACSSSLVAVHLACEALRSGGLDTALAGGVFVLSTPEFYASAQAAGMLSASGRCAAFDAGADGFVPGEGAGVVVLRRLRDALADGDFVHGVIRGSGVNQDGASNGITAPRVGAQEALLGEVWDRFGVDAGSIGLVEAHGTGTALGDPVEFEALSRAFGARSDGRGFCALGTVKANLGHTAAAAGVAGVVKAVLALRHGKVPPLVHFERVNPRIALEGSPFYVNGGLREWVPGVGGSRLAAVSAFGFSGTNAHVVIEQAPQRLRVARVVPGCLVVLSAASVEQVREQAGALLGWADSAVGRDTPLADVSFTLLTGRRHVRHRLAVVVSDRAGLVAALSGWLENGAAPGVFVSETSQPAQHPAGLVRYAQECLRECGAPSGLDGAAYRERLSAVAELFVQGQDFDFGVLFAEGGFARVPLPTYPFARRRYWVREQAETAATTVAAADILHPLVQRNTSDLLAHRFTTMLTGEEFFLADHVVGGQSLLPGVVSLEMARAAVEFALGELGTAEHSLRLRDIVWPQPMTAPHGRTELHITLERGDSGKVGFAVHSGDRVLGDACTVHCQGVAELGEPTAPRLDLDALRTTVHRDGLPADEIYAALRARGIEHGPSLRALGRIRSGDGQVLAELERPAAAPLLEQCLLHPSLLDGALQTVAGLTLGAGPQGAPAGVPFAVDTVEVFHRCPERIWVRTRPGTRGAGTYDIDLCAEDGTVCVRIQGLHLREGGVRDAESVYAVPAWEPATLPAEPSAPPPDLLVASIADERLRRAWPAARVLDTPSAVRAIGDGSAGSLLHVLWSAPPSQGASATAQAQDDGVLDLFRLVKSLLAAGYGDRELHVTVLTHQSQPISPDDHCEPAHASVHGFTGALLKEYPHWQVRLVDLPLSDAWPAQELRRVPANRTGHGLAYRSGCWYAQRWLPAAVPVGVGGVRRGGVYVVVGGAGGIGVVWSEYVARVYGAQVVWLGRRPVDAVIGAGVERVAAVGPRPVYVVADVTDAAAVERAAAVVRERFGAVHGVVHSGLVLADRSLASMSEGEFRAALDVKVAGSVHLVEAFGGPSLELVLFFSSLNAFLRAAGQSNYAAGCTFQDAFAARLAVELPGRVRVVHWGYWGSVGAVSTPAQRERMRRLGLVSIEAPEAMAAVEAVVAGPRVHTAFLNTTGTVDFGTVRLGPLPVAPPQPLPSLHTAVHTRIRDRHGRTVPPPGLTLPSAIDAAEVLALVSEVLGVEGEAIDAQAPLEEYGWDRVRLAAFVERLRGRGIEADERSLLTAHTLAELIQETRESTGGVDALIADLIWHQLSGLDWFGPQAAVLPDLAPVQRLPTPLRHWLDETLRVLDEHGHVRYDGLSCTALRSGAADAWSRWATARTAWATDPGVQAQVVLIETVLKALPDVLTGRRLATEILFPDSSMDLVQGLYQNNAPADFFNGVLADAVAAYVERRLAEDPAARVRILEVGAGTGGTSAMVFRRLRPYRDAIAEYRYTDLSPAFLQHAERTYGPDNPFLRYGLLDIERSPADQDIELGTYDLVIAANVVHATSRIHRTLGHIKSLLRPNGLLLLNELTRNELWVHLIFGLLEGWWLTQDQALRIPGSPVLTVPAWRRALSGTGFDAVGFPLGAERDIDHHVITAQSDGVISVDLTAATEGPRPLPIRPARPQNAEPAQQPRPAELREKGAVAVQALFAEVLRLRTEDFDAATPFDALGVDSIVVVQLTSRLRKEFSDIPSTLLFECRTVHELTDHLLDTCPQELAVLAGVAEQPAPQAPQTAAADLAHAETHAAMVSTPAPAPAPTAAPGPTPTAAPALAPTAAPQPAAPAREEIAIIGVAGRYPGADTLDVFWANLRAGRDSVTELPADRWDHRAFPASATGAQPRWGGFLSDVDKFDPQFFGISPREADHLDPQERLFAECAYATLQDAGYTREAAAAHGRVGVFVGAMYQEYQLHAAQEQTLGRAVGIPGNPSSIANRVSYVCDFHGPSVAVDTMCSSSLTAIHLACQSLLRGESDLALAGGVNVSIHPNKYLILTQSGLVPTGGRCAAFGAGGDGFVPAEGVGAVLLKPLSRAIADGDRIHGVIKGSALNHGGRTNGYTVPNPRAHRDVITRALADAGVDPVTVGYVEAHGTGTSLGDPIEIAGLSGAFGTGPEHPVAIGSVKSNIGHAESAAGIAGLTKILLQLRHGELVPSLHAQELNPHIDFASTAFRVQRELAPWPSIAGAPRRAGLSSFGAGGTNAHLVIEEYVAPQRPQVDAPGLIVLSARDETRLRESAANLLTHLREHPDVRLADLAHTLQSGREAMEERLAFRAASVTEVRDRLRDFVEGRGGDWHRGRATGGAGRAAQTTSADHDRLLAEWVTGARVDWNALYTGTPGRIALPSYPFARERYWLPVGRPTVGGPGALAPHPLIHRNTSSLRAQRFETTLTGAEFFLADHVVAGEPVLPAVASLEMARAAVALGREQDPSAAQPLRLTDVLWTRPVTAGVPLAVELTTAGDPDERVSFEITGPAPEGGRTVFARGDARPGPSAGPADRIDLDAVRAAVAEVSVDACYAALTERGVHYGPAMRGLAAVWAGDGQVLAKVRVTEPDDALVLHPGLLDAALHAGVAVDLGNERPAVPFAVGEVELVAACPAEAFAWLRLRPEGDAFDVDLCDDEGRVYVRFSALAVRPVDGGGDTLLLAPSWRTVQPVPVPVPVPVAEPQRRIVLAAGPLADSLGAAHGADELVRLTGGIDAFEADTDLVLRTVRRNSSVAALIQLALPEGTAATRGLSGAMMSARREHPALRAQIVELPTGAAPAEAARLLARAAGVEATVVRAGAQVLMAADWSELPSLDADLPWRPDGVYLLVGGAGGIGALLAADIRRQTPAAIVVVAGRSATAVVPDGVVYRQADVSDGAAIRELVADLVAEYGRLDGVVQAAGVLRDGLLAGKRDADVAAVLAPKVAGTRLLDEATKDLPLDFFVLCSSLAAVFGNVGQADYAAANGFLDAFAEHRAALVARGARHGRTVSVNWPLWAEGGMAMDPFEVRAAREGVGLRPLPTGDALRALYRALACGQSRVMVLHGDRERISVERLAGPAPAAKDATETVSFADREELVRRLTAVVASVIKLPAPRIDRDVELTAYGMDSITGLEIVRELEATFGPLDKTLLFEFRTVDALAAHLMGRLPQRAAEAGPSPAQPVVSSRPTLRSTAAEAGTDACAPHAPAPDDIAIVGVAGRYPGAASLEEFWANLRSGVDSVTEVPAERWDPQVTGGGRWGGFLDGVDTFDSRFFGITPREAELLDPQERLFLECAYATLQDAGYTRAGAAAHGEVGVFVGVMYEEYQLHAAASQARGGALALAGSPSSIANRVSYVCDFHGPSVAVDTMCSSSLTAIHLACQSLLRGESDLALAGGVNVSVHPNKFLLLDQGGFLGESGRCAAFGAGGDGYVPGEGVGAVLLKPLSRAVADGDRILGVIKGSAVNHGGRTNGYTVPDPAAQRRVIRRALDRCEVDPRTVSYVEAHGTGTSLGDPIEIAGLSGAFGTGPEHPVAIGSVKSNIGHAESAAGIAGLTKILLQLRHGELVPSLHAQELNPHIDFASTAFRVQRELAPWPSIAGAPRRAGLSSFGAGGTNAHLVIEEYVAPQRPQVDAPGLIVLSARDETRLRESAANLHAHLREHPVALPELAYTLQVGREAMRHRLAFYASDLDEVRARLDAYLDGRAEGLHQGQADRERPLASALADAEDAETLRRWVRRGKYDLVLELWTQGLDVDWAALYEAGTPRRAALPTYPFARERHWIDRAPAAAAGPYGARLHPLAQRNTSDFSAQRYSATLTGGEFFLADHVVQGRPMLPGVAVLELARAAVELTVPDRVSALTDVVWLRPFVPAPGLDLSVVLVPGDGRIAFEVQGDGVHASGEAATGEAVQPPPPHDRNALLARLAAVPAARCYEALAECGIAYGPAMRALVEVHAGDGEVLARLRAPGDADGFVLHPAVLDAALHAGIALDLTGGRTAVPFAVDRVEMLGACPAEPWAWLRRRAGDSAFDVDLFDDEGQVCVRLVGVSVRPLDGEPDQTRPASTAATGTATGDADAPDEQAIGSATSQAPEHARVVRYLTSVLAAQAKLPVHELAADVPLSEHGIESVMALQIIRELERTFGPLGKALLFERRTVDALADYFRTEHAQRLAALLGADGPAVRPAASQPSAGVTQSVAAGHRRAAFLAAAARPEGIRAQGIRADGIRPDDIAIVGVAGRYPGAASLEEFWANLRSGVDSVTEVPAERWDPQVTGGGRWGGFLDGVDTFDALFFHMSPADAELTDPQERLFLECAYATLQDAGYTRARAAAHGRVGVFVGVMYEEYQLYGAQAQSHGRALAVGGVPASIANRVSYVCDFRGPSVAVDTMCSSSLTAIHLACQSLLRGESDLALAGGVNVSVHPNKFLLLDQGGFLGESGRCAAFGAGGDGYVPGEGVGAVLLKPLSRAVADGDRILGVIKGSAVNHGGRTNGYTVPDPAAQAEVIRRALDVAQVDPVTVGYVEAHGTGTSLGDPIEIAGLARAFGTGPEHPVAIGSVKSNIGHAESASGIAGLTKILLQLRHGELVPSLHAQELNPLIDFASTPLRVQRELAPWPSIAGAPRRAGLSSFGAGGSNAHLVIEEYPVAPQLPEEDAPGLIVLSAADAERLTEVARGLLDHLQTGVPRLADLSYTLQVGREEMTERLAFLVRDTGELRDRLADFVQGRPGDWHRGRAGRDGELAALFAGDDDARDAVAAWIAKGKHDRVLAAWVNGLTVDWELLHRGRSPRRIGLPGYPFARERHWIEPVGQSAVTTTAALHPLVQRNVSTLWEQRFETTLTGAEFFLADHRVGGRHLLPAAAALEMAYTAAHLTLGSPCDAQLRLTDVVWQRPVDPAEAGGAVTLAIGLAAATDDTLDFTVAEAGDEERRFVQGSAYLRTPEPAPVLDLAALRADCTRAVPADEVYDRFAGLGIAYGPRMRALRELRAGTGQVLARTAPTGPAGRTPYTLHPGLLDAALQAAAGLPPLPGAAGLPGAALPFALDELAVHAPLDQAAWVWVRRREEQAGPDGQVLDLDLCDDDGRVRVTLRGLRLRAAAVPAVPAAAAGPAQGTLLLAPVWQEAPAREPEPAERVVILPRRFAAVPVPGAGLVPLDGRIEAYEDDAALVLRELKRLTADGAPKPTRCQLVVPEDELWAAGLGGLLLSAAQEYPGLDVQTVQVPADADAATVTAHLDRALRLPSAARIRGGRVAGWTELPDREAPAPWCDGGVYLVTGGRGGIGRLLAAEIVRRTPGASVVLVGRSPAHELPGELGDARVSYRQADVADSGAVRRLVAGVLAEHGRLDGVLHAAGVLRDGLLAHKTPEDLAAVLAPKSAGARNLDEATRDLPLDLFVLFSSATGSFGNVGQADYAAANGFLDRFADHRAALVARGERHGTTVSVGWPLWAEGGMTVDDATVAALRDIGLAPLATADAMRALYRALASGRSHLVALTGELARLRDQFVTASVDPAEVTRVQAELGALVSRILLVDAADLDPETELNDYGFEPVTLAELARRINLAFALDVGTAELLEHTTLGRLAHHLCDTYPHLVGRSGGAKEMNDASA
ncbi:SDR family NAD(P)-dependent oxidoreductase [Streptomyces sp. NBC_01235]|uniref:SDR family NAD(P)-dependent oxidoreductase n=1 Tax=Streptomyces sp. NBC_01235 TaxID=2903788 RepID=UPI002E0DEEAF|nr:SDR family NAD(P)-dependent oxidoreductase [Streptomyces sp. NBC_01235]